MFDFKATVVFSTEGPALGEPNVALIAVEETVRVLAHLTRMES